MTMKHNGWERTARRRIGIALAAFGAVAAVGTATLVGPVPSAQAGGPEDVRGAVHRTAAEGHDRRGAGEPAARRQLDRDARAVHATGATGVIAQARDASGRRTAARAGAVDLEGSAPVDPDAYYRIGSDTKTFTSVVALQLVAEGRLELTDTVERWLPGVVRGNGNDGERITVRNLLLQTSGLANYTDILFADPADLTPEKHREQRFTETEPAEQVALAMTEPPAWLPDADDPAEETRWAYSNTNYVLVGMIIEKVTGHSWEQEIHERVIEPLGLERTMTLGSSVYVPQPTASAYTQFPGRDELTDTTLSVAGGADGGIISTPGDMNTFLRGLMDGRLLAADQLREMKRTVPADFTAAPGTRYGLGIAWRPAEGCEKGLWFHGGTSFGTASETAVTEDGSDSAAAAAYTIRFGDQARQEKQNAAMSALVEHAVCD